MINSKLFRIYDTEKNIIWTNRYGVSCWTDIHLAISSWNNDRVKHILDYPELIVEQKKYHKKVMNFKQQHIFKIAVYDFEKFIEGYKE